MDKYILSTLFVTAVPLFATIIGFVHYGKLNRALKYLLYFVVLGTSTEIANLILTKLLKLSNNMPIGNAYFFLAFLLLGLYFMLLLKGYIHRWIFIAIIVIYELYFLLNLLVFQSIFEFPAIPQAISNIICFGFAVVFFHKTMVELKTKILWENPFIYTNMGILLYFSGSLFYSVLFNVILENAREFTGFTRDYFYVLNMVFYLLIALGFWKAGKQKGKK